MSNNSHLQNGFFFARCKGNQILEINDNLQNNEFELFHNEKKFVTGACRITKKGTGLWSGDNSIIVYDTDITNLNEIIQKCPEIPGKETNFGKIIWMLYKKHGYEFAMKLKGQFACAIHDCNNHKTIIATDPLGLKSVFYSYHKGNFVVASQIRHLFLSPKFDRMLNDDAIYQYLYFSTIPSPNTIYKHINKLKPGFLVVFNGRQLEKIEYFNLKYQPNYQLKEKDWIKAIPNQLEKAIDRVLNLSDLDHTGCFLSGGTDSSTIAGYSRKISNRPIKTFSIGFDEPKYNELDYAHIASRHYNTIQHDYIVTPEDVIKLIDQVYDIYDEPFGNSSIVPAYYCAKLAKENNVEFMIAGDGGDEIFGGNERYVKNLIFELYGYLPETIRREILEPVVNRMPEKGIIYSAQRYIRRANLKNPERFYSYNLLAENLPEDTLNTNFKNRIDTQSFIKLARNYYNNVVADHVTDKLQYLDLKFTITDNDIRKVTKTAESVGVTVRYPYLDTELLSFTTQISPKLKVKLGGERYIFKKALRGFLPEQIILKKKHGMGLPIALWFKKNKTLNELLYETLFADNILVSDYINKDFLTLLKNEFNQDVTSYYGDYLWVLLMLELWLRRNR